VLTAGLEDEWAEMIASAVIYARNTKGLQFRSITPNNEPDILREGIRLSGGTQYVTTLRKLAQKLDTNGLSDVRFIGPDYAVTDTGVLTAMLADPLVMSKVEHFATHGYSVGAGSSGVLSFIENSAYPNRTLWQTEFNVWCSTCDDGTRGNYDWAYCRGTAEYLLSHLSNGVSAGLVYEGYDSYYAHHGAWGFWGLFAVDNENAAVKSYTARKNFYTMAQISKWVRPGAQRVDISGTTAPFSPLLAFKHDELGQVTIVGINTSGSAAALAGSLANLPDVTRLQLCYTTATTNLANGGNVMVSNKTFSTTIPRDCVFTLYGAVPLPLKVTTVNLPLAKVGDPYLFQMAADGGAAPYVWGAVGNASLPSGLTISGNGVLSGVPSNIGEFTFSVTVTDAMNVTIAQPLDLRVSKFEIVLGAPPQSSDEIVTEGFKLTISADAPGTLLIQRTSDFVAWENIRQVTYESGTVEMTDNLTGTNQTHFYRALWR